MSGAGRRRGQEKRRQESLLGLTRAMKPLNTHDQTTIAAFADFLRVGVPPPPARDTPEHVAWSEKYGGKLPELNRRLAICNAVGETTVKP